MMTIGAKDNASAIIAALAMNLGKLSGGGVIGGVVAVAAALAGIGVASLKAAGDFQAAMTKLKTGAGELQSNMQMVSDGIKKMATDTGTSAKDLADAMYMVESAGQHGADGLKVLKAAAEAAKVGGADLTSVTKALTFAMHDYGASANDAAKYASGLVATTKAGEMTMGQLTGAMGNVLPIASSAGVKFNEVGGALATMTTAGVSAQRASQNLAFLLRSLEAPSTAAQKALKSIGLTADDVNKSLREQGLAGTLTMIEQHLNSKFPAGSAASVAAFKAIAGGAAGYNAVLELTGKNMATFVKNSNDIAASMQAGAKDVQGWSDVVQTFNFQLDRLKAAFEVLLLNIGQKLLPIATQFIKAFADMASGLANMIGGVQGATKSIDAFKGVGETLGIAFGGIVTDIQNVGKAFSWVGDLFDQFKKKIADTGALATLIKSFIDLADALVGKVLSALKGVGDYLNAAFKEAFGSTANAANMLKGAVLAVATVFENLAKAISGAQYILNNIGSFLASQFMPMWKEIVAVFKSQVVPAWNEFVAAIGPATPALKAIAEVIMGTLVVVLVILAKALEAVIVILLLLIKGALDFATGILQALAQINKGIDGAKKAWKDLGDAVGKAESAIEDWAGKMKAGFASAQKSAEDWANKTAKAIFDTRDAVEKNIGQMMSNFGTLIHNGIQNVIKLWDSLKTGVSQKVSDTVKAVEQWWGGLGQWLYSHNYYIQDVVDFWNKTTKQMGDTISKNLAQVQKNFQTAWNNIVKDFNALKDNMGKGWTDMTNTIGKVVSDFKNSVSKVFDDIKSALSQKSADTSTGVSKNFNDMKDNTGKAVSDLKDKVVQIFDDTKTAVVQKVSDMVTAVANFFGGLWQSVSSALGNFKDGVVKFFSNLVDAAKKFGSDFIKAIASGINDAKNSLGQAIHDAIASALQAAGFHNIPGFAGGVSNFKGGWAVVGERGPELMLLPSGSSIIPSGNPPPVMSSQSGGGSGGGGDQMMTITLQLDGKTISKVVTQYQANQLRMQGAIRNI